MPTAVSPLAHSAPPAFPVPAPLPVLAEAAWQAREAAHRERVCPPVAAFQERRARGESHPVWDFLFVYYGTNRCTLTAWRPPVGVALAGDAARLFGKKVPGRRVEGGWTLDLAALTADDRRRFAFVRQLLSAALARPPRFGCFGLHEWAMVYRAPADRRHQIPLRMDPTALAAFVESQTICCSHYDAFRFFTPPARPRNPLQPGKNDRPAFEQFGCVHLAMDLYKWCYKLHPWLSSELTADCFALAQTARELDMRASPYDLRAYGFAPVCIETPEGRATYVRAQERIATAAMALAKRLLDELAVLG